MAARSSIPLSRMQLYNSYKCCLPSWNGFCCNHSATELSFPAEIVQSLPQSWDIELSWDTIYFAPYNESIGEHFEKNVLPIVITKNLSSFQTYNNWYGNAVVFEEKIPQLATILLQPLKSTSFTANLSHFPFSTRNGDCTQRDRSTHRHRERERERERETCPLLQAWTRSK